MAWAWASIFAAVGWLRMKLQLLQPIAGVRPTPLLSALAGAAALVAAKTASGTAARPAMTARISLFMGPPWPAAAPPRTAASSLRRSHLPEDFLRRSTKSVKDLHQRLEVNIGEVAASAALRRPDSGYVGRLPFW